MARGVSARDSRACGVGTKADMEAWMLKSHTVSECLAWFILPERPIIAVGVPLQPGSRYVITTLPVRRRFSLDRGFLVGPTPNWNDDSADP
jgi:hypothetical protein